MSCLGKTCKALLSLPVLGHTGRKAFFVPLVGQAWSVMGRAKKRGLLCSLNKQDGFGAPLLATTAVRAAGN